MATRAAAVYSLDKLSELLIPFSSAPVSAGKPVGPLDDDVIVGRIDLIGLLACNPATTFIVPVAGDSMIEDGIEPDDLLVVDRSLQPIRDSIIIVDVDGELTVKKLSKIGKRLWLVPGNKNYSDVEIKGEQQCSTWGVVVWILKKRR